jgi:hypothetical protein
MGEKLLMTVCGHEIRIHGRLIRIGRLEADGFLFLDDPQEMLNGLRQCGTRVDLFTFVQKLKETTPKYRYPMEWDDFAAVPISTFDHWWMEQIGFKARNKAKQAEKKGVVIREVPFDSALVKGIWEIYNESPVRQGRRFSHYGKDLETVYREEATFLDRSVFIGAFLDGKLIGFVKLVADETGTQAATMNILSMVSQRDKAPTNALIAQAVRWCSEREISFLVYSRFSYGGKGQSTMIDFKERNGFQRVDVPRYYVPLTHLGRAAFHLGLHHRFVDRLPRSVVERIREVRTAWYERKFQTLKESA